MLVVILRIQALLSSSTSTRNPTTSLSLPPLLPSSKVDKNLVASHSRIGRSSDSNNSNNNNKGNQLGENRSSIVIALKLRLEEDDSTAIDIRFQLLDKEAPDAMRFILSLLQHPEKCTNTTCTIYRGEPVPDWWGSPERPDRYFDGGRWGPPYALIQGGFLQTTTPATTTALSTFTIPNAKAEEYRPTLLERGMVAWAGGKGGPHFFIAMADHPEWGNAHTVWAKVYSLEDLHKLDTLLVTRPLKTVTTRKNSPVLSNFVTPIPFTIHRVQ